MDYYAWEDGFVQIEKRFWGKWNGRAVHLYDFSAGGLQLTNIVNAAESSLAYPIAAHCCSRCG